MSDGVIFNPSAARRISAAVKKVEERNRGGGATEQVRGVGTPLPLLGKITSDLADGATADVQILEGTVGSESVPGTPMTVNAHNFTNRKLWANSYVQLFWPYVNGSGGKWRIVWSDSAQWLYGTTSGSISSGSSGTVNSITLIDGRVGPGSSITAYNKLTGHNLSSGVYVLCCWNQANDRWEIYATVPGSGGTAKLSCFWLGESDTAVSIAYPSTISTDPIEWTAYPTSGFSDMSLTAGTNNNRFTSTTDNNGLIITGHLTAECLDFASGEAITIEFWLKHKNSGGTTLSTLFNRDIEITTSHDYETMGWVVPVELDTDDYFEAKLLVTPTSPTSVADFNYDIQMSVQKTTTGG